MENVQFNWFSGFAISCIYRAVVTTELYKIRRENVLKVKITTVK